MKSENTVISTVEPPSPVIDDPWNRKVATGCPGVSNTQRKNRERLYSILADLDEPFFELDLKGNFTFCNDAMAAILGYTHDAPGPANFSQYMDALWAQKAFKTFNRVYTSGRSAKGTDWEVIHKEGGRRYIDVSISLMRNEKGASVGFRGTARDMTEQKIMEGQLVQAQKLESIGQLAAGIAHEINTPLQYVSDNTHFLKSAFDDIAEVLGKYRILLAAVRAGEPTEKIVKAVDAVADHMDLKYLVEEIPLAIVQSLEGLEHVSGIVRSMKHFSHLGSEEKTFADINQAIQSTVTVARNEWKYIADVVRDFDPRLPPVPCFAGEFNQVILNILVNAVHAIGDVVGDGSRGKGKIRFQTRREGEWGWKFASAIRDPGSRRISGPESLTRFLPPRRSARVPARD